MNSDTAEIISLIKDAFDSKFEGLESKVDTIKCITDKIKVSLDTLADKHDITLTALNTYITNHYAYHQKEKKKFWKYLLIAGVIILAIAALNLETLTIPWILKTIGWMF